MGLHSEKSSGIQQFTGGNFANWKFRVERHLAAAGCLEAIRMTAPTTEKERAEFLKMDAKAQDIIVSFIHDDYLSYVQEKRTSKEMWDALTSCFERKSNQNQTLVRKELACLKLKDGDDMNAHIMKFESLVRDLKAAGAKPENADLVSQLFLTLPESYDAVVTAIESLPSNEINLDNVKIRLLAEEAKKKHRQVQERDENSTAFTSKKKNSRFQGKCHKCGRYGHMKKDCRSKSAYVTSKEAVSFVANSANGKENDQKPDEVLFTLDSGASDHFVKDKYIFNSIKELSEPRVITIANGEVVVANYIGEIHALSNTGVELKLNDVLYSPHFHDNLMSVNKIVNAQIKVNFNKNHAELVKSNVKIATATRIGNLFEMKLKIQKPMCNLTKSESGELWHKRMCHIGNQSLTKLIKDDMVIGIPPVELNDFCEICTQSKHVRNPFTGTRARASRVIEHIHSDVCGPISPITHDGYNYIVTFIDDYTHFAYVYLIKRKSEVFEKFKEFEALVSAKFGCKISLLTSDNGGEYKSNAMISFCKHKGIKQVETIPYSPQQNGVAERFNRTLMEKVRAMIIESSIPKNLWGEAVYAATYVINRSPTKSLTTNKTPAELWYGEKPDLSKLRIFGCLAYAWIPQQKRKKLDPKSEAYVMIGYNHNGYRLWDCEKQKIILARDCKFNEFRYPFKVPKVEEKQIPIIERNDQEGEGDVNDVSFENVSETQIDPIGNCTPTYEIDDDSVITEGNVTPCEMPTAMQNDDDSIEITDVYQGTRRSERIKQQPVKFKDYFQSLFEAVCDVKIPNTYADIDSNPERDKWLSAVNVELESMNKNKVWSIVPLPPNKKLIKSKWVFVIKTDENGKPVRYKARLVAKGFLQKYGVDYEDTYSPVAKLATIRTVLAVGVTNGFSFFQLDVKTAFLHGELKEEIYMEIPDGLKTKPNMAMKLLKSLYGLKQSPRCWNEKFNEVLINLDFKRSQHDYCLYVRKTQNVTIYMLLYVDDVLLTGNNKNEIIKIKQKLLSSFEMSDCGLLKHYLGTKIEYDQAKGKMFLSQEASIDKLLAKFGMMECNTVETPMEKGLRFTHVANQESSDRPYRELLGSLMYVMLCVRPDICFAVGFMGRYQENFNETHYISLKRILRYLKGTKHLKLTFEKSSQEALVGFVDADWAADLEDRKSTSGYIYYVYGCPVLWSSKKQTTVATSSSEAEYVALSLATSEGIWLKGILEDMGVMKPNDAIKLFEDNAGCIAMAKNTECKRSKHIDIKHHFLRDHVLKGNLKLEHVSTRDQIADIFTKALDKKTFVTIRNLLKIV